MLAITVGLASVVAAFVFGVGVFSTTATSVVDVSGNTITLVDKGTADEVHVVGEDEKAYDLLEVGSTLTLPEGLYTVISAVDGNESVTQTFSVDTEDVTADGEYGLEFNNTDSDRVQIDDSQYSLDPREDSFTISLYAYHREDTEGAVFIRGHTVESTGIEWRGTNLRAGIRDDAGNSAKETVSIDWDRYNYVHATVAFDSETDEGHIYLNGEHEETFDYSHVDGSLGTVQPWNVGGSSRLDGGIDNSHAVWAGDDVRFYDRTLDASDVEALADGEHLTAGLIGHWPMNDGAGGTTTNTVTGTDTSFVSDPRWTTPLAPLSQPRNAP